MRAQRTVEHREIGRKPRARRGQHALPEQAIQAARLRERGEGGKEGAVGTPMASHMAAANALVGHEESKAAAHAQSKPPSMPAFEQAHRQCAPAARGAARRANGRLGEQVHRV